MTPYYLSVFGMACLVLIQACSALKPTTIPPLLDVPTYSMATINGDGATTNMNILTYATPINVRPDRVWTIGLFKDTLSHENFCRTRSCVLQLLTEKHVPLVKILGGCSGKEVHKQKECEKLGFVWEELAEGAPLVLPDCAYYLKLSAIGDIVDVGSHCVANCKVEQMFISDDETKTEYVSTGRLRELGIITELGRVAD